MAARGDGSLSDYRRMGEELGRVVRRLEGKLAGFASGADAAALAQSRRILGDGVAPDRVADLRADYRLLGRAMRVAKGASVASLARERRMIRRLVAALSEVPADGGTKVEQLDSFRARRAGDPRAARRRHRHA